MRFIFEVKHGENAKDEVNGISFEVSVNCLFVNNTTEKGLIQ